MKVGKPVRVPILHRVVEVSRKPYFHVAAMVGFSIDKPRALLDEMSFWALVSRALGEIGVVDEGVSKACGEVLVAGSFFAPRGEPLAASYARVTLGSVDKRVAVVGDRFWVGNTPTDPIPFTTMPIDWSRAFGGPSFARNPHGKGIEQVFDAEGRPLLPLANIETYGALVRSPSERPEPAGFSSLDVTFAQRKKRAGTYDKAWIEQHFPGMAPDMDAHFHNLAPDDQWIRGFFKGDEAFTIENMSPHEPRIEGTLPGLQMRAFATLIEAEGDRFAEIPMRCDTVWLFPSLGAAAVAYHGSIPIRSDDAGDIRHLLVACEEIGGPEGRDAEHYKAALARRLDKDEAAYAELSDSDIMPAKTSGFAVNLTDTDIGRWAKREGIHNANMRRGMERRFEKQKTELAKRGIDTSKMALPDPPLAKAPDDPDEIVKLLEEQKASAEARKAEVIAKRDEAMKAARAKFEAAGQNYDELVAKAERDKSGPPKFRAAAQLEKIAALAASSRARGMPLLEHEANLKNPEFRAQLERTEQQLFDAYRRGAHLRPTAPAMSAEAAERARIVLELAIDTGESLAHRDFTGANFAGMTLKGVDFTDTFLESACFAGADLTGAKFERAVLAKADLKDARLKGAKLAEANLGAADLTNAVLDEADMSGVILMRAKLEGACFAGTNLAGATWLEATLGQNDLSLAVLEESTFAHVAMKGVHFVGAQLSRCTFIECDLEGSSFEGAMMHKTSFVTCTGERVVFKKAKFNEGVIVKDSKLPGADFRDAELEKTNLRGTSLPKARFERAMMKGADLSECDLSGARMDRANLTKAMMIRTNFDGASLHGVNLMDALMSKSLVAGADFTGSNLFRADLSRAVGDGETRFAESLVTHVRFQPTAEKGALEELRRGGGRRGE